MKKERITKPILMRPQALFKTNSKAPSNSFNEAPAVLMNSGRLYRFITALFMLFMIPMVSKAQNKVVAYVPNWIDLNTYITKIDYAKLTHINISFENPTNASGDLNFNSVYTTLINKAHANNVKVLMSIGGGSASEDATMRSRYFSLINSTNRAAFASKLANYVVSHNLDGIDIDLEGPAINGDYGAFVTAVSNALKPNGKLLSAAVSQGYGGANIPTSSFQYFDYLNIMAYDAVGPWDPNSPGQHSSLDFAKTNTQYWINRGLPKAKAILGVPFYGYGFGSAYRDYDYSYTYIVSTYSGAENSDQAGSTIWYNGIPTIKAKTNYAFDQGIGGIMIWELDYDATGNKSLLTAIDQVFKARTVVSQPVPQGPYNNVRISLPGKIEAENYDVGGQDVAYNDVTATNDGAVYRTDGVDIQATTDTDGGYNIGWIADGEWMEYSVNVATAGQYDIGFRSASTAGAIRMEVDGVDATGTVNLPNTGAYQTWTTTTKSGVTLAAGDHIIRLFIITGGFNLNYVSVTPTPVAQGPFNNMRVSLPGKIEAENYDLGGQGVAYNDLTSTNDGAVYRTDGVDIQATTDTGGGYNVGWTSDGEWLEYSINVTATGLYNVDFRTASGAGALRMEVDGVDATGTVNLPNTGAYQTWATTTKSNVSLTAGNHIIRLFVITGGFNFNYINVSTPVVSNGPGFLHASGKNIVNKQGNFVIKAINLGNFMVQEGYMLNLGGGFQHNIKQKIADAVGTANRDKFYDDYYANFITKADIDSIAKWGFNSIRLPMHYNLFTPLGQPDTYIEKGFTIVDNILSWCKANNIYLILDLHATPGGQNSGDISDYVAGQPSLWESQANRDQTVKLWRKFAERYVNEEYIGGYDLINETNWTLANNNALLMQIMKDITTSIRQVDNNHILFIEGNSYANDYNGMTPKWDNNMAYSFHKYWNDCSDGSLNFVFAIRDGQNVPIWMGEFGENSNNWIADAVTLMNKYNIGWAIWPYKKMSSVSCVSSFKQPSNWTALANFINGGAQPSQASAQATLNELIEDVKVANCTVNRGYLRALFVQPGNTTTAPFATINLPGKIIAANYDEGKQGYAYSDVGYQNTQYGSTVGNTGSPNNGWYYRNDGVDLQYSSAENGPTVGWTENGEWMQYTVNASVAGTYTVKVRVAGNGGTLSLSSDGTTIFNAATIGSTGGWDTWQTVTLGNVNLTAGKHTFRATITTAGYNLSYFDLSTQTVSRAPYGGTPAVIPGKIEAENYDLGGQGLAYNDSEVANQGGAYRTDGVDIQACTDAGAGYNVAYTAAGEWMEYSVNVTAAGNYDVEFRVATTATGKKLHIEKNGVNLTGSVDLPNTGAWQTWQSVTVKNIALTQGNQIVRIAFDTDGINLNYVNFTPTQIPNILPSVSLTAPSDSSVFINPAAITLKADANDTDGTISKVEFFNGSTLLGSSTTAPYSFAWSSVGIGNYTVTAKATDNNGGVAISSSVRVIVTPNPSNKLPGITLSSPVNNASFTAPASISIEAAASDTDGVVTKVEFYNGSTLIGTSTAAPFKFSWTNVAKGNYAISAKATDNDGATTSTSAISIVVNPAPNQAPSISLTSPANNSSYNAPASITINANATDADGSIAKVEFFSGSTLLGSDNTSPYSVTWTNVAAGTYTITAKATDNEGATSTSSAINVTVYTVITNPCSSVATYKENNGYVAGSRVQNAGKQYECKPYPYSGWCNGAAWAYAPGTGTYWTDAWTLVGTCGSAKMAAEMGSINAIPNPFVENINVEVTVANAADISVKVFDKTGQEVGTVFMGYLNPGTYNYTYDASNLKADIYIIQYYTGSSLVTQKIAKTK